MSNTTPPAPAQALAAGETKKSWRDDVAIHPAAELFPMMPDAELDALAADIKKTGRLTSMAVTGSKRRSALDTRSRIGKKSIWLVRLPIPTPTSSLPTSIGGT